MLRTGGGKVDRQFGRGAGWGNEHGHRCRHPRGRAALSRRDDPQPPTAGSGSGDAPGWSIPDFIEACDGDVPDVALVDIFLPSVAPDGARGQEQPLGLQVPSLLRTAARQRKSDLLSRIPCLAVSWASARSVVRNAQAQGFKGYVPKPHTRTSELLDAIERLARRPAVLAARPRGAPPGPTRSATRPNPGRARIVARRGSVWMDERSGAARPCVHGGQHLGIDVLPSTARGDAKDRRHLSLTGGGRCCGARGHPSSSQLRARLTALDRDVIALHIRILEPVTLSGEAYAAALACSPQVTSVEVVGDLDQLRSAPVEDLTQEWLIMRAEVLTEQGPDALRALAARRPKLRLCLLGASEVPERARSSGPGPLRCTPSAGAEDVVSLLIDARQGP